MNDTVDPDSAIGQQARAWALAVFGETFPPERAQTLRRWLDADPRHARAYDEAERVIMALGEFDAMAQAPARRSPASQIGWLAAAALAACLVVAVAFATRPTTFTADSAVRTVALRDGSTALLAPGSSLKTAGWWNSRHYVLEHGEALFDVRHVQDRRFEVAVGSAQVTVLGTRFDVRKGQSGEVRVAVQRGLVAVTQRDRRRMLAHLGPGDALTLDGDVATRGRITDPALIGAWSAGRLSYTSAPLGDILADINAYGRTRALVSPEVARLRLTASLRVDQADAFIASLPDLAPVTVTLRPDGVRRVTARSASKPRSP